MDNNILKKIKTIIKNEDLSNGRALQEIAKLIDSAEKPNFAGKKPGDRFFYQGIEWVILGEEQGGVLCVTAKAICRKEFDKDGCNNWKDASLRKYLNTEFVAKLDKDDLIVMECDLVADNGDKAYGKACNFVGLLSCDLYRKYRDIIPRYDAWIWTCTPWACDPAFAGYVRGVDTSGELNLNEAYRAYGVVPACIFILNR